MLECYCNHCDTYFDGEQNSINGNFVCPRCGVGVITKNPMLIHPANKPMNINKAKEIIFWLGWRGFKLAQLSMTEDHPELRPIKRSLSHQTNNSTD